METEIEQHVQKMTTTEEELYEARFYQRLPNAQVRCSLCPRECLISEDRRGYCKVRENRGGILYSLTHSQVCTAHIDPIEKKPLYHFHPGTLTLSVASAGCNVNCRFCQNWEISQSNPEQIPSQHLSPSKLVELAKSYRCPTIAFTYSEPTVFGEYVMDTAALAKDAGIHSISISNGYIREEVLSTVYRDVDAVKIDLKAYNESFYRKVVSAELRPVLSALETLKEMGKWIEIVYLILPSLNDNEDELKQMAAWIREHLGSDVPLHFTQFHPDYRLHEVETTPKATLEKAKAIANAEGLSFVYVGNVPGHPAGNTYCPQCNHLLIERTGFLTKQVRIVKGTCPHCQRSIPGNWEEKFS